MHRQPHTAGMTLLEVLVGLAIGLFVAAAATALLQQFLFDNRQLLLRMRLEQQMQAVADAAVHELRRAGHWEKAQLGVADNFDFARANPYAALDDAEAERPSDGIRFSWSGGGAEADPNGVSQAEATGLRLVEGQVKQLKGGNWQPLTDAAFMTVTAFEVTLHQRALDLERHCERPRPQGSCATGAGRICPPRLLKRDLDVRLEGFATREPTLTHALNTQVQLRNDVVEGECPR
ncbi:prepilin-type N-terminal cleavage/methylation domain-containing protein [Azohydromonas lata]|uniref:Prepilin-type N-terminal cleavage/methylation domain-containing protein n=1 Tax=Azohydromonas lata TaxID=45677 RepID=A0ABU5IDM3_9BURK|nr:prepilin-type N-terminal cleavage/methylation domain-containing protein [Azohydromonas lata]MDZ5457204.1 prepilin-type N-terminal cleavage/methylation domain-containing protein [Azohydromonas lata]